MTEQWSLPAYAVVAGAVGLAVLMLLAVGLLLAARRARRERAEQTARADDATAELRTQVEAIEERLARTARTGTSSLEREYVITGIGEPGGSVAERAATGRASVATVPAPLFADLVLRESVVQAASLVAGVRRALAPETRQRIRSEMRREVKRARKQRKADLREARREWEARQRAEQPAGAPAADDAA